MANDDGSIVIDIILDDGSVVKGFAQLKRQAADTGKALNFKSATSSMVSLKNTVIATIAAYGGFRFLKNAIDGAIKQEEAINKLNTSLRLAGTYTEAASKMFVDFADSMQKSTGISADTILGVSSLARNFARTNEEARKLTQASIELSAATGGSLESSLKRLGQTYNGVAGNLTKLAPSLKYLTEEQLKAGAALDILLNRFGGAAAARMQTFGGLIQSLSISIGSFTTEIGKTITKSPVVIAVLGELNTMISEITDSFKQAVGGTDFIGQLVKDLILFSFAINDLFIRPIELAYRIVVLAFEGIRTAVQGILNTIARIANGLVRIFAPDSELSRNLQTFSDSTASTFKDFYNNTKDAFTNLGNQDTANGIEGVLTRIQTAANNAGSALKEVKLPNGGNDVDGILAENLTVMQSFQAVFSGFKSGMNELAASASINFKKIGEAAVQGLGQAAGNAFAAFGKAIAKGENAIQAFIDSFLASMGQMAIQLGTQFILQGIAMSWAGLANGPALIAAGAALATFGGVLSALGGGGESSASAAGSASTGSATDMDTDFAAEEDMKPTNSITINVEGSVFDSDGTGQRIASLINAEIDRNGKNILRVT